MSDEEGWSLTESDPSVFTALLKGLGVQGLQVEDLWSLDEDAIVGMGEVKAFVFLFKYVGDLEESSRAGQPDPDFGANGGYFANQVITNACASLAILNAVFNIPPTPADSPNPLLLGSELENLKEFGQGMDSMTLGQVISNSEKLRETHNSFARADPFSIDPSLRSNTDKEEPYHFVAYAPIMGQLYELDGLQPHPRKHGAVPEGSSKAWLGRAREVIRERIESYPAGAVDFNLLAITEDPMPGIQRDIQKAKDAGNELATADALTRLEEEEQKRKRWAFENSLRRHNHISFAHALLLELAKAGKLESAMEGARTKGKTRREREAALKRKFGNGPGADGSSSAMDV